MSDEMFSVSIVAAIAAVLVFTIKERKVVLREGPVALVLAGLLIGYAYFSYDATGRLGDLCSFSVVVPDYSAIASHNYQTYLDQVRAGVPPDSTKLTTLHEEYPEYCR